MNFNCQLSIVVLIVVTLLATACKKDDTDPYAEGWKQQNEKAFNDLENNPEFQKLYITGSAGPLYYREIQKGTGKRTYYNSRAEVYYKGWFVATHANEKRKITEGKVFDQRLFDDGVTFKLALCSSAADENGVYSAGVIDGWKIALQFMVEGDKWEIWMPWRFCYGEAGKGTIPGYSTLAFEIELIKAIDPDEYTSSTGSSSSYY